MSSSKIIINEVKAINNLRLLPGFIQYILNNRIEEFVAMQWKLSEDMAAPIMKHFAGVGEAERIRMSIAPTKEFWGGITAGDIMYHIKSWVEIWRSNQLPLVSKDQLVTEDIVIGGYVRKRSLMHFLSDYTSDLATYEAIDAEIDFFLQVLTTETFKAFVQVQNERMDSIYRNALASEAITHIGNWSWELPDGAVVWSDELYRIFGMVPQSENISFDCFLTMLHPDERELHVSRTRQSVKSGETGEYDLRIITKGGEAKVVHCVNQVTLGRTGEAVHMSGTCQDITEAYRLRKRLEEGNRFADALIDSSMDLIMAFDRSLNLIAINKRAADRFEWQREKVIGKRILEIFPDMDKEILDDIQKSLAGEICYYPQKKTTPGEELFEAHLLPLRNNTGLYGAILVSHNIKGISETSVKISELSYTLEQKDELLRRNEEKYQKMIEEVQDYAIILLDTDGTVRNWNKGAEKIKGYSSEDIIGKNFRVFYEEKDRASGLPESLIGLAAANDRALHEGWRVRKDGTRFWGSIVITALHDDQGKIIGFSKVTRDLSERRKSEEQLLEKNSLLEHSNETLKSKNKELEAFNHVASHDLQEPLRKIRTFASLIIESYDQLEEARKKDLLDRIIRESAGMQRFIEDLLLYSGINDAAKAMETVDLNIVFNEVRNDFMGEDGYEMKVDIQATKLPVLKAIPFQLRQLFQNLIGNAIKYAHKERKPLASVTCEEVDGSKLQMDPNKKYYLLKFSDNGIGFDQKYAARIFEPFQRLHSKTQYAGSGVGLAICKTIVRNHDGMIYAEGRPDGADFYVALPVHRC